MTSSGPKTRSNKANLATDMIGSLIASFAKLSIFQPADTVATNAVAGKEKFSLFRQELSNTNWIGKIRLFYSGAAIELMKKVPSNSYRYPAQRAANDYIDAHYHEKLHEYFAENTEAAQASIAGGVSAVFEPFITQPLDTIVVNQQIHHMPIFETIRTMTYRDCYRAALETGVFRNLPAGVTLFGGAQWCNHQLGNDDKHSNTLDIASKTAGGLASALSSQPGEVLKVQMQTNKWTFWQAVHNIPIRQFFTNGAKFRLMSGGLKAGLGLLIAEKAMDFSAELFSKEQRYRS